MKHKKRKKRKNALLSLISKNDHKRFRIRVVKPEKGKGRKDRPKNNKIAPQDCEDI